MGLVGIFIIMTCLDGGDAVSEVLSTILMVVVVILPAAIVGSLVFGIWPSMEPSITMATATRSGENVTFMVHGGTDVERVTNITCWIGGPGGREQGGSAGGEGGVFRDQASAGTDPDRDRGDVS